MTVILGQRQLPTSTVIVLVLGVENETEGHSKLLANMLFELRISLASSASINMGAVQFFGHLLKAARRVLPDKVNVQEFTDLINNTVDAVFGQTEPKFAEEIKSIYTAKKESVDEKRPSSQ